MMKIFVFLLISILCPQIISSERIPEFCIIQAFEGIYNFGIKLKVKKFFNPASRWTWTYNSKTESFIEPPEQEPSVWTLMTSFYVSEVPKCEKGTDYCKGINDAMNTVFQLTTSLEDWTSVTMWFKDTGGTGQHIEAKHHPWFLNHSMDIWPKDWDRERRGYRASVYWPEYYEVYYIAFPGLKKKSTLLWNDIKDNNWYKNMKNVSLNSDIRFVGMFYLKAMCYAVGNTGSGEDEVSRVYQLTRNGDNRGLEPMNITLRQFFGCYKESVTDSVTISVPTLPTQTTICPYDKKDASKGKASQMIPILIISVVVFFVLLILLLLLIGCIFMRSKGSVSTVRPDVDSMDTKRSIVLN